MVHILIMLQILKTPSLDRAAAARTLAHGVVITAAHLNSTAL